MSLRVGERIQQAFGGGPATPRNPDGYWPTPDECTMALMLFLRRHEPDALELARQAGILEPACGDGALVRPLQAMGFRVRGCDLVDRGFGHGGVDFTTSPAPPERAIITNPPYTRGRPEAFIRHAATFRRVALTAFLLPVGFWNGARRLAIYQAWTPAWILPLTWRPDFTGDGNGTMRLAWNVWSRTAGRSGEGRMRPLAKPDMDAAWTSWSLRRPEGTGHGRP